MHENAGRVAYLRHDSSNTSRTDAYSSTSISAGHARRIARSQILFHVSSRCRRASSARDRAAVVARRALRRRARLATGSVVRRVCSPPRGNRYQPKPRAAAGARAAHRARPRPQRPAACRALERCRRSAADRRGTARSRCRRSRRRRRGRRRRRCPRPAPPRASAHERLDQPLGEAGGHRAARRRSARSPSVQRVEALAGLLAEVLPRRPAPSAARGGAAPSAAACLPTARQMSRPTRVGELDRSHRHAEGERRLVDGLRRDAFVDAAHRRHQVRREHAVDEEARRALHRQRQLVDLAHERRARAAPAPASVLAPTTISTSIIFAHRIEEVQADQPRRVGAARVRDVLERDARRVGGEDRVGPRAAARASANSARFASTFSKIASMITSARATPSPATSGIRRSAASRTRRGSRSRSREERRARAASPARGASRPGPAA